MNAIYYTFWTKDEVKLDENGMHHYTVIIFGHTRHDEIVEIVKIIKWNIKPEDLEKTINNIIEKAEKMAEERIQKDLKELGQAYENRFNYHGKHKIKC